MIRSTRDNLPGPTELRPAGSEEFEKGREIGPVTGAAREALFLATAAGLGQGAGNVMEKALFIIWQRRNWTTAKQAGSGGYSLRDSQRACVGRIPGFPFIQELWVLHDEQLDGAMKRLAEWRQPGTAELRPFHSPNMRAIMNANANPPIFPLSNRLTSEEATAATVAKITSAIIMFSSI